MARLMINHVLDIPATAMEINGSHEVKFPIASCKSQLEFAFLERRALVLVKRGPPAGCKLYEAMEQTRVKMEVFCHNPTQPLWRLGGDCRLQKALEKIKHSRP